jgi:hypothetical protein
MLLIKIETWEQNVVPLELRLKEQNVVPSKLRLGEQNVAPSELRPWKQNVDSLELRINESSNLCGSKLIMVTIYNSNGEIIFNIDWEF